MKRIKYTNHRCTNDGGGSTVNAECARMRDEQPVHDLWIWIPSHWRDERILSYWKDRGGRAEDLRAILTTRFRGLS